MLLSHAHNDHIGDVRPSTARHMRGAGDGAATRTPNFAAIAALKNAAVLAPGELSAICRARSRTSAARRRRHARRRLDNIFEVRCRALHGLAASGRQPHGPPRRCSVGRPHRGRAGGPQQRRRGLSRRFARRSAGADGYGGSEGGFVITFTTGRGLPHRRHRHVRRHGNDHLALLPPDARRAQHERHRHAGPNEAIFMMKSLVRPVGDAVARQRTGHLRRRDPGGTRVELFQLFVATTSTSSCRSAT